VPPPAPPPPVARRRGGPKVLVDEDFRNVVDGEVPAGWKSLQQLVGMKRGPEPAMEVKDFDQRGQLELPPLPLTGDFSITLEFSIPAPELVVGLELEGRDKISLHLDGHGLVDSGARVPVVSQSFRGGSARNTLQLNRLGSNHVLKINGILVNASIKVARNASFRTLRLKLGPKDPAPRIQAATPEKVLFKHDPGKVVRPRRATVTASPRIFSVKVEVPDPGP
jgi:hypothetical protein